MVPKSFQKAIPESTLDRATKNTTMTCNSTCFQHPPIFKKYETPKVFQWFLHVAPSGEKSSHDLRHPQQVIKIDPQNDAKTTTKLVQKVISKMERKIKEMSLEKAPQMGAISAPIGYQRPPHRAQ